MQSTCGEGRGGEGRGGEEGSGITLAAAPGGTRKHARTARGGVLLSKPGACVLCVVLGSPQHAAAALAPPTPCPERRKGGGSKGREGEVAHIASLERESGKGVYDRGGGEGIKKKGTRARMGAGSTEREKADKRQCKRGRNRAPRKAGRGHKHASSRGRLFSHVAQPGRDDQHTLSCLFIDATTNTHTFFLKEKTVYRESKTPSPLLSSHAVTAHTRAARGRGKARRPRRSRARSSAPSLAAIVTRTPPVARHSLAAPRRPAKRPSQGEEGGAPP